MKHVCLLVLVLLLFPVHADWQGKPLFTLKSPQMPLPTSVTVADMGDIFVLDGVQNRILVFDSAGQYQRQIIPTGKARLKLAMDMVMADGQLAVADTANARILLFSLDGNLLKTIKLPKVECAKGQKTGGVYPEDCTDKPKAEPTGISYQAGTLYWSDRRNHRVCRTLIEDQSTHCWGDYGKGDKQFRYPFMLTSDNEDYLYVVDVLNARIQVFNQRGKSFGTISQFGTNAGELLRPNGITSDKAGNLFVSNHYRGTVSTFKGRHYTGELLDQTGKSYVFDQPVGIRYKNGLLYIVELGKKHVQVIRLDETDRTTRKSAKHQKASRQECITCHLEWSENTTLKAMSEKEIKIPPASEQKMCLSCHHGAVIDSRQVMYRGKQHPDSHHRLKNKDFKPAGERSSPMDKSLPLLNNSTPYCGSCHTPHTQHQNETGLQAHHNNSWMRLDNSDGKLCSACHEDHQYEKKKPGINHPLGIKLSKPPQKKAKGYAKEITLHKGLPRLLKAQGSKLTHDKAIRCETCHLLHGAKETSLLLEKQHVLCSSCHLDQTSKNKQSAHQKGIHPVHIKPDKKMTLDNKKVDKVECKSCHDVHGGLEKSPLLQAGKKTNQGCEDCHSRQNSKDKKSARKKGIHPIHEKLDKPVKIAKKQVNSVECQSCHSVHKGVPKSYALTIKEKSLCQSCHKNKHSQSVKEAHKKGVHPVYFKPDRTLKMDGKPVEEVACNTCHSTHKGLPNTASLVKKEKELCSSCHAKQHARGKKEAHKKGVHPVNFKLKRPLQFNQQSINEIQCQTCHSVHKGKPGTAALVKKDANQMCVECHPRQHANNKRQAQQRGIHPVNIKLDKPVKIANKKIDTLDCLSCHSVHKGKPNTPVLHQDHKNGQLCKNCHQAETAVIHSDHNLQRTSPDSHNLNRESPAQAGVCGSCHSMHKAPKGADKLFVGAGIGPLAKKVIKRDRSCFACHRDKGVAQDKQVKLYTHPHRDLVLKSNPKQFPLVDKYGHTRAEGQIACITCHNPHRWMPKGGKHSGIVKGQNEEGNVLNSFLNHKSPQGSFCTNCHGIESQIRFKYYHDKRGRPGYADYLK